MVVPTNCRISTRVGSARRRTFPSARVRGGSFDKRPRTSWRGNIPGYRLLRDWLDRRPPEVTLRERYLRLLDEPLVPAALRPCGPSRRSGLGAGRVTRYDGFAALEARWASEDHCDHSNRASPVVRCVAGAAGVAEAIVTDVDGPYQRRAFMTCCFRCGGLVVRASSRPRGNIRVNSRGGNRRYMTSSRRSAESPEWLPVRNRSRR